MVRNRRDRYDHTEYGGGEGSVQRLPTGGDGQALPLKQIPGRTGDAARVLRQAGLRGDMGLTVPGAGGAAAQEAYQDRAARDLDRRSAGYGKDAASMGEQI